jgi:diaminopimelate decarboxylase
VDHFTYIDGTLHAENVSLQLIAESVGTPVYVYSTATLLRHYRLFQQALSPLPHLICFSVKSLSNVAILKLLADMGAGMDVVSVGEYRKARAAGVPGDRIVFSGVGKTRDEMSYALGNGIRQFNVESEAELRALSQIATGMGSIAPVTIRINPDVDARTHAKIATGKAENKFGIPLSRARSTYALAARLPGISIVGIDVHIGSQLTDLAPFEDAYRKVAELTEVLRSDGHSIERLDLGGGLGIPYSRSNEAPPLPIDYGSMVRKTVGYLGCEIEIEPGRLISGNAGILLARVIYIKKGEDRDFVIVDAAMNDLVRPALYDAHHDIVSVEEPKPNSAVHTVDVVGPVCETGDTFARSRALPPLAEGDLVAFRSAGAYGAVMASEYNTRPLVPEVLVKGEQYAVIRARPSYEEMISRDILPAWL